MKIIFLVIASHNTIHQQDLETQKNTWMKKAPEDVLIFYLRGWNKNYFQVIGQNLFVPCQEKYDLILTKTILGISYVLKHYQFDFLIRTNVSTYFEISLLKTELSKSKYNVEFVGGYVDKSSQKVFGNLTTFDYITGTGIFMTKKSAEILSVLIPEKYTGIIDDLAITHYLVQANVRTIRMSRNNLHSTHLFLPTYQIRAKNSANRESASRRMVLIDDYFNQDRVVYKIRALLNIYRNEFFEVKNSGVNPLKYLRQNLVYILNFLRIKFNVRPKNWV